MPEDVTVWGSDWGSDWGNAILTGGDRLLHFSRGDRHVALMNIGAERTEELLDNLASIPALFDLDTAVGDQLDKLGTILLLPRYGATDARYRVYLQIQTQILLSSAATTPTILRIVELFTGRTPTSYAEDYPMGYTVGAVLDDASEIALLEQFLDTATAAAYRRTLILSETGYLSLDYHPGDSVAGAGYMDYHPGDPIIGAGTMSYELIGE